MIVCKTGTVMINWELCQSKLVVEEMGTFPPAQGQHRGGGEGGVAGGHFHQHRIWWRREVGGGAAAEE